MNQINYNQNLYLLNVGCCRHEGDWNWKEVRSPFSRLYYVTEGTAQVRTSQGLYTLKPDKLYYIPAYTMHDCLCDSHFVHYYIHIYEDWQNGNCMLDDLDMPFEVAAESIDLYAMQRLCALNPYLSVPQSNPESYDNHQNIIDNMVKTQQKPISECVESLGLVYILLSRFLNKSSQKHHVSDNRIQRTLVYIRKHIDIRLDIEMLASIACMSKDHYIRVFKREMGETPYAYVMKRKQEAIERYLVTTQKSIKVIATAMGYDDYTYFIKCFKNNTGLTPQQYREKHLK